jgi:hypothetical protein
MHYRNSQENYPDNVDMQQAIREVIDAPAIFVRKVENTHGLDWSLMDIAYEGQMISHQGTTSSIIVMNPYNLK